MAYYMSHQDYSFEEKDSGGDLRFSRDDWEQKVDDDFDETLISRTFTTRCSVSSESDGDVPPPPPPNELDSSDYSDSSPCGTDSENSHHCDFFNHDFNDGSKINQSHRSYGSKISPQKSIARDTVDDQSKRDRSYRSKDKESICGFRSPEDNRRGQERSIGSSSFNERSKREKFYRRHDKDPPCNDNCSVDSRDTRSNSQKITNSNSFSNRSKRDPPYEERPSDDYSIGSRNRQEKVIVGDFSNGRSKGGLSFHSSNEVSCYDDDTIGRRNSQENCIVGDDCNDESKKEQSDRRSEEESFCSDDYCMGEKRSTHPLHARHYDRDYNADSLEVGKRRYTGDCGFNDLAAHGDGKSDVSSELPLDIIRFDYSDISSSPSQRCPSIASHVLGTNRSDHSTVVPTNSSFDRIPHTRASTQMDPPASIDNVDSNTDRRHRVGMIDAMQSCFIVLKMFSLRCAFDDWRLKMDHERESDFRAGEFTPVSRASGISTYSKVNAIRRYNRAFEALTCIIGQATMRSVMLTWKNFMLETKASVIRRRFLKKQALHSWRDNAATAGELRQKYFLMMIVNRWRLYAEDCIDLRQKRYSALVHWATAKVAKSFAALKVHAKQSKANKAKAALLTIGKYHGYHTVGGKQYALTSVAPSTCDSQQIWPNDAEEHSFKMSYRSPEASMVLNRTPDYTSRLAHSYCARSSQIGQPYKNTSHVTREVAYCIGQNPSPRRLVGTRKRNDLSRFSSACTPFLQIGNNLRCSSMSQLSPPSQWNRKFVGITDAACDRSKGIGVLGREPSLAFNIDRHDRSKLSFHNMNQLHTEHQLEENRLSASSRFMSASPASQYAFNPEPGLRATSNFPHSTHVPFSDAAPSVRSIRDYYQERFVIANVLDDMVSKVEQRHSIGFYPSNSSRFM